MEDVNFYNVIGYTGALLYILSYFLLSKGLIKGESYAYHMMNFFAPIMVLTSLTDSWNAPSVVIQSVWLCLSVYALCRLYLAREEEIKPDPGKSKISSK